MAVWNSNRLHTSLHKGDVAPLYFLYGDENFLIEESLETMKTSVIGEGLEDFNLDVFYGQSNEPVQIRDVIETLPMMTERRMVIIKEAQDLKEKAWDQLMPIIENPVDSTVLVFIATKIDKRKKYIKRFQENGVLVEYKRPFDNQIPQWIDYIAKKIDVAMTPGARNLIHQLVGANLNDIYSELLKLSQYIGTRSEITEEDVLKVVSKMRVESVFELTNAIGQKDRANALVCLAQLLDKGQNEFGVLALVARHLRILKLVKQGQKEGLSGAKLSQRAGVSPYFLKDYLGQTREWTERNIEAGLKALLETDRALKSSPVASHIWLENFIIRTCS